MGTFRLCSQCVLQRETGQQPNVINQGKSTRKQPVEAGARPCLPLRQGAARAHVARHLCCPGPSYVGYAAVAYA